MRTPTLALVTLTAALAALTSAAAIADPPAVGAPTIPGPFAGAPTTQNQYGGEETVNFTSSGKFIGVGRAPEHYSNFDVQPRAAKPQARLAHASRIDRKVVNDQFAAFAQQLQTIAKNR